MKFHKKHPYLFWELIGLAVLFIDFLLIVCFFGLLDLKGDAVYAVSYTHLERQAYELAKSLADIV